jgi:hypothetical protein
LEMSSKADAITSKIDKWSYMKLRSCRAKKTINKVEISYKMGKIYFHIWWGIKIQEAQKAQ